MAVKKGVVKKGDKVKIDYTGTLEDGTVFDTSEKHGAPLEFEVGSGQVIQGFDDAVIGMKVGEEKEFELKPEEAYGEINPDLVKDMPKDKFQSDMELEEGMMLLIAMPNGAQLPARVVELGDDTVKLDLNHPLAGKTLKFKVKLVEIVK